MPGHVRPLSGVAVSASETEVLDATVSAMLFCADVIDFQREDRVTLMKLTVLAKIRGSKADLSSLRRGHAAYFDARDERAFAWSRSMSWPTLRYFSNSTRSAGVILPRLFNRRSDLIRAVPDRLKRRLRIDLAASTLKLSRPGAMICSRICASVSDRESRMTKFYNDREYVPNI
jgi:hypothetical protein